MSYNLRDLQTANNILDANIERSQDGRVLNFEKIAQYIDGNATDATSDKFLNIDEANFFDMTGIKIDNNGNVDLKGSDLIQNEDGSFGIKNNDLVMNMLGSSAIFSNYVEAGEGRREKRQRKKATPERIVVDANGNISLLMRRSSDGILAPLTKFRSSDPLDPVSFANGEGLRTSLNGVININKQRLGAEQRGLGSLASAIIGEQTVADWLAQNSTGDPKTDAGQLENIAENGGDLAQVTEIFKQISSFMTQAGDVQNIKPEEKNKLEDGTIDTLDIDTPIKTRDKDADIPQQERTDAISNIENPQGAIGRFFNFNRDTAMDKNPQLNELEVAFPDYVEGNTEHPFNIASDVWNSYTQDRRDLINRRSKEVTGRTIEKSMDDLEAFFDGYNQTTMATPDTSDFPSMRQMANSNQFTTTVKVPGIRDTLSSQNLTEGQVKQAEDLMGYYDTNKSAIQASLKSPTHIRALKENPLKYIQRVKLGLDPIGGGPQNAGKDTTVEVPGTGNTLKFPDYDADPDELKSFINNNYDEILRLARDGNVLDKVQALLNDPVLRIEDPIDLVRVDRYDPKHDINAYTLATAMAFAEGGGASKDGFYTAVDKNLNFILRGGRDITALQQATFNRSAEEAEQRIKATILNNREVNRQKALTDFTAFTTDLDQKIIDLSGLLYEKNKNGNVEMKKISFRTNPEAAVLSQTIFTAYLNAPKEYQESPEVLGQMRILYGMHLHQLAIDQGVDPRNIMQKLFGLAPIGGNYQPGVAPLGGFKIRLEPTGRRDPETQRLILGPDGKPEQQIAEGFFEDSSGNQKGKTIDGKTLTDAFGGDTRAFVLLQLFASEI